MRFPKIRSVRPVVRQSAVVSKRMVPKGEYGAIIDRLGAMSERELKAACGYRKIDEFSACASMGIGLHKADLGGGRRLWGRDQATPETASLWRARYTLARKDTLSDHQSGSQR